MKLSLTTVLVCLTLVGLRAATDDMKAFPPAARGMIRYVISVPQETNEADLRIELMIGKTVNVDPNNVHFFGGRLEQKVVKGWGYNYYVLPKLGPMAGTLIAVDPNVPRVDRFITLGGEPHLMRYNSKLPLVVYVPEGVEVRYRLWRASPGVAKATPG